LFGDGPSHPSKYRQVINVQQCARQESNTGHKHGELA